jgi:DMSO reductase family type II enzyme chaperone
MVTNAQRGKVRVIDWKQADYCRFFAYAFGPPSEERHRWFSQPGVADALAELWEQLSPEGKFPGFSWFPDFESYEAAYIALFDVGAPEPPVPLCESAHVRNHTPQELVLENTHFFEVLGLRANPSLTVPDHLVTQLEFLSAVAYVRDHASDKSQRRAMTRLEHDFLQRHLLNWIGTAQEKLRGCPFVAFRVLFALMVLELRRRHQPSTAHRKRTGVTVRQRDTSRVAGPATTSREETTAAGSDR